MQIRQWGRRQVTRASFRLLAVVGVIVLLPGLLGYWLGASAQAGGSSAVPDGLAATAAPAPRRLPPAPAANHEWPRTAWVAVPVATVWIKPGLARPVDAPELAARAQISHWLSRLTFAERLDLDNRLQTQALLDDPMVVLGIAGGWAHVLVSGQRGSVYPSGIAGWVPAAQLSVRPVPARPATVTVAVPRLAAGSMVLSYGTTLPVVATGVKDLLVETAAGRFTVPTAAVRRQPLAPAGPSVVRQAERFVGLPYLWAGTSGFGFDCSGLTYMVYRQFGVTLPRDAADQAGAGRPVAREDLQPGDLVFFTFGGTIDHVGIYAGGGVMIDSPQTGGSIEVVPMWGTPLAAHYAGARRYFR